MNKLLITILALCPILTVFSDGDKELSQPRKPSKAERLRMRTGGMIEDQSSALGRIVFANKQKRVPNKTIEVVASSIRKYTRVATEAVQMEDESVALTEIPVAKTSMSANVLIELVDNTGLPTVLYAPESGWGYVNVAALAADNPSAAVLAMRVEREMWRSFGYLCGACDSTMACVMSPVVSLSDLDNVKSNNLSPETMMRIEGQLRKLGIRQFHRGTYAHAVREGWAPQPTNEYQKAIWDKVHAIPSAPMKIEFDPKKGR